MYSKFKASTEADLDRFLGKATVSQASVPVAKVKNTIPAGASKKDRAMALYAGYTDKSREAVVAQFMADLNMTKAGATTYFYLAKKG